MTTYYVRKTGNDANGGTDSDTDAVLTLARGVAVSTTDDTLDVGVGTWAENFNSARIVQGVGMFKTHISGITSTQSVSNSFADIKLTMTEPATGCFQKSHTLTDVFISFSAVGAGFRFANAADAISITRSVIVHSNPAVKVQYFLYAADEAHTLLNSIFYFEVSPTRFVSFDEERFSFINCIIYGVSNITTSGDAFGTEEYNCWYNPGGSFSNKPGGAFDATSLDNVNPLFEDAAGGDFRLTDESPCILTGKP